LQLLFSRLSVRERTLALLDAATGLRVSELLALRWCDVDFENLELRVTRSIWHQVLGNCKTEASAKPDGGLTAQRPYVTQSASGRFLQNARDERW